jgi:GNAT superfamily N-acetyltransferase
VTRAKHGRSTGGWLSTMAPRWLRPDDRMFLSFVCDDPAARGPLATAAAETLSRAVRTVVDATDTGAIAALETAGFTAELVSEASRIRFEDALAHLDRAWIPTGFSIQPANVVDEDRLFALDNALRRDVPGTDGWRGDRRWFHDELAEAPPFDPSAYLVGRDDQNDALVGLVRIWRNPTGPRLGLIGVVPDYRNTVIAAALLERALTAASAWGHDTFTAETSLVNTVVHPRMRRIGAEVTSRFVQLVLHPRLGERR